MGKSTGHETSTVSADRRGRAAWVLFIAGRYLRTRRRERRNTAAILSVLGLAVGVTTLITVLSVMNALQMNTIESIISFNSFHIRMGGLTANRLVEEPARLQELRRKVPAIQTLVQFADLQALGHGYFGGNEGMRLRAVPPDILALDPGLAGSLKITEGDFDLAAPGSVVLGYDLARSLGVGPGDRIRVMAVGADNLANPVKTTLTVTGVFQVGYYEYDRYSAFVSLETGGKVTGGLGNLSLGIKLADRETDWLVVEDMARWLVGAKMASRTVLARDLVSWRQYNAAIFGALRMEKLMMMFIVGLIFVVVAVNIFYALRRSVVEKTADIGVLRALGAPGPAVRLVFVMEGLGIGLIGSCAGLVLGWLVTSHIADIFWFLEAVLNQVRAWTGPRRGASLADSGRISLFYLDRVPARLIPAEAVGIAVAALLASAVAALTASRRASRVSPAEILRSE
jgi:lipoprotein-releasing system permease protein